LTLNCQGESLKQCRCSASVCQYIQILNHIFMVSTENLRSLSLLSANNCRETMW